MTPAQHLARLAPPAAGQRPRVVIDTDAANEIDDQFAIAWALLSPLELDVQAMYAAPFSFAHRRDALRQRLPGLDPNLPPFNDPALGMQRSFDEIIKVASLCGRSEVPVFLGTPGYLGDSLWPAQRQALHAGPIDAAADVARAGAVLPAADGGPLAPRSAAVDDLVARALASPLDQPLYVLALGCPTNVACALLMEPRIREHIVVVWTSGYPSHAPQVNQSFNLEQDLAATQVLLDSGVPHVYLPGFQVGAQLRLSLPEVQAWVRGRGALGDYLHHLFVHNPLLAFAPSPQAGDPACLGFSWVIWDLVCVAWLLNADWLPSDIVSTPRLGADLRWQRDDKRHPMREAYAVQRDAIFRDFLGKLAKQG